MGSPVVWFKTSFEHRTSRVSTGAWQRTVPLAESFGTRTSSSMMKALLEPLRVRTGNICPLSRWCLASWLTQLRTSCFTAGRWVTKFIQRASFLFDRDLVSVYLPQHGPSEMAAGSLKTYGG